MRTLIQDGGLAPQGIAHSYQAKQLAQHGAMRIFGLPHVANEIGVRLNLYSSGSYEPGLV